MAGSGAAAGGRWIVHAGLSASDLADKADIELASVRDPNAKISTTVSTRPSLDLMWRYDEHWGSALSVGLPPHDGERPRLVGTVRNPPSKQIRGQLSIPAI